MCAPWSWINAINSSLQIDILRKFAGFSEASDARTQLSLFRSVVEMSMGKRLIGSGSSSFWRQYSSSQSRANTCYNYHLTGAVKITFFYSSVNWDIDCYTWANHSMIRHTPISAAFITYPNPEKFIRWLQFHCNTLCRTSLTTELGDVQK